MGSVLSNGFFRRLKSRFDDYVAGFDQADAKRRFGIELKKQHCLKVAEESALIAGSIGLGGEEIALAKVIGLVHDIGRFSQFAEYGTFNDRISVDHGQVGAGMIRNGEWLAGLDRTVRSIVETAVALHNKAFLPSLPDERTRLFSRLIRDADKLDIFRVLRDIYNGPDLPQVINFPPGSDLSDKVFQDIVEQRRVSYDHIENRIDAVVLRIAWLFDINFTETLELVLGRGYYDMLRDMLPATDKIGRILDVTDAYLARRL